MKTLAVLAAALLLAACGGGGNGTSIPAPPPTIREVSADLAQFVDSSLGYVQSYSEGYVVPTASQLAAFDTLATALIDRDISAAESLATGLGFELIRLTDTGAANNELYCLQETALRGQGFYCADFDAASTHHVSVPHPLYDRGTNVESGTIMRATGARFLSVSTTHRCANAAATSCSGMTSACGAAGPYKVSDVAHNVDAFFYRFGKVVHDRSASTRTVQLHGCGASTCPSNHDATDIVARLSAGTMMDLPGDEPVNRLHAALNLELATLGLGQALSCSEPGPDKQMCGTTNTLGRYINGQADPCTNPGTAFTDSRWLHIEQNRNLRDDDGAGDEVTPGTLANALNSALGP